MRKEAVSIDDAVRAADAANTGVVVLSDTGDTVFGGTAGDSNLILEAILRLGIKSRALMPLIEAETVAKLVAAGEGAQVTLALGGLVTGFFKPLTVTGTNLLGKTGAANDIDVTLLTITGQAGATFTLTANTTNVEIDSATQFTVTLGANDKTSVDMMLPTELSG